MAPKAEKQGPQNSSQRVRNIYGGGHGCLSRPSFLLSPPPSAPSVPPSLPPSLPPSPLSPSVEQSALQACGPHRRT